ncbi:MAG: alpha/beta hydrolase, partial [Phaeodactylibacter sp.]|nr:alpha/beta hydrolase [Phaeodactylibacter sp.]
MTAVQKTKPILFLAALFVAVQLYPQGNLSFATQLDIPYYPDSMQHDDYIKSRCKLDIRYPEKTTGFPTLVWFHGGGLRAGEKHFPKELLSYNLCIVSVNYRLYPEAKAPAYIQDAAAAVAWVFKNIDKYGGDAGKIFVSGHSAGGYLASMVGLDKQWLGAFGVDANDIAGLIPLSGHTITHFTIREERGLAGTKIVVDSLAPLYHVRADAPPLLLIT